MLDEYLEYDKEGNKRVYVPAVIVVDTLFWYNFIRRESVGKNEYGNKIGR